MQPSTYSSSNNLIYNVHIVKKISNLKRRQVPGGERRIVSVSDEVAKQVRFKPRLRGYLIIGSGSGFTVNPNPK